jgi:hypothetical protein
LQNNFDAAFLLFCSIMNTNVIQNANRSYMELPYLKHQGDSCALIPNRGASLDTTTLLLHAGEGKPSDDVEGEE